MNSAENRLEDAGYEGVIIFKNFSYDDALVGVTTDNRAVYDYDKMVEWLITQEGLSPEEAVEFIECDTLRAIPYAGEDAPIVMFPVE